MPYAYKQCAQNGRARKLHTIIAEKAFGGPLPAGAVVHHLDENSHNNNPTNLVICPDQAYHMLIHRRARALRESGNANWLRCQFCKRHDDPASITWNSASSSGHHKACRSEYLKKQAQLAAA
jgi:hypothetical protein